MARKNSNNGGRLLPIIDYIGKELEFLQGYRKSVTWKVYENKREKRLEIERWVESIINATLDAAKISLALRKKTVPETSRETLFSAASLFLENEVEAVRFSQLAKVRNTLAHRYLEFRWEDIKMFFEIAGEMYPGFIKFLKSLIKN